MQTINLRVKVNETTDVAVTGVTPAEALVLRIIHKPGLARQSDSPDADEIPPEKLFGCFTCLSGLAEIDRDGKTEYRRLLAKYPGRSKEPNGSAVKYLFNGAKDAIPQTFADIGMRVPEAESGAEPKAEANAPTKRRGRKQESAEPEVQPEV